MSRTVMVRLQVAVLPQSSVAVQVRVTLGIPVQLAVVTSLKVIDTEASQASEAVASPNVGEAGQSITAVTSGQVIVGGVTSWITIFLLQVAVLPQASVAVQVRVIPPVQPGDTASTNVMDTLPLQLSEAVAVPKSGCAGQSNGVTTVGQVIVGGVMSRTVMVRLHVAVLPQSSVAVQVRVTLGMPVQLAVVTSL